MTTRWTWPERLTLPEPMRTIRPVRTERQHWQKLDKAEGELEIGYDAAERPVRVEYHWIRYFSRANPALADVYTAELWARENETAWLYIVLPNETGFVRVEHDALRPLLARHLNVDIGPVASVKSERSGP